MANKAISSLAVGASVYLNVGGTRTEFLVVHQGNPYAGRYDASCDGTWILAKDCPVLRQINASGTNSYASGAVDSYLEGDFYNSFDDVAKSAIKQVKIPYVDSNKSVKTGSNGLSRKVFLLSGPELGMSHTNMLSGEGYRLSYFPSSTVAADKRVSNWNGAPVFYWTRSPNTGSTTNMWAVSETGALTEAGVTNWKGVRPALILSSDTLIDGNGNVTLPVDLTAHKTLVGGTAYTVQGGKCMVNGTVYNILKGRTLIEGTAWDIALPEKVHIYGVEWDWTSSGLTNGTRTDDAADFNDPSPAVNNGSGSSPFDNLMPWSGMVKETRSGGVEVKEPKYYFKWTKTGKKLKLQIADGPVEGFSVDPVNRDRGDGLGELDYSYIGRYHCGSDYKSTTNVAQKVSITRSTARSGIHNLGSNFWQMDFAQFWYVNMLFLVEFADWNGERIGRGCSTSGSKMNNGQTDAMQYHTGTTAANRDSYGFTQYRNIEGWWDNVYDWMDGCYYNSNGLNVISNPNNFSDSANGTLVGKPTGGYPSDFAIPTASGLEWALYPSEASGSTTTYVPDYWYFIGSYPCLRHGGSYGQSQDYGPFYVGCSGASGANVGIGCRLQERPPKAA